MLANSFFHKLFFAAAMLGLGAVPAQSEVLLAVNNTATITPINGPSNIVISGLTTFSFNVPGAAFQRVMITFSAECGVGGANTNRLDLDILLDQAGGVVSFSPVAPTGAGFITPLCAGNGTASNADSLAMGNIAVAVNVPPGVNSIQVRATPTAGIAGPGRIGARTLVVMR
jgi:hypothetical protein